MVKFIVALLLCAGVARGADIYVAQTAQGAGNGTDEADAYAVTFLTTSGNWGGGAGQIGPDVTVHLVGVISTPWTVLNNGTAGHPITIKFETGASMSATDWATGPDFSAINGSGVANLTIDGGVNGYIRATTCGDGNHGFSGFGCGGLTFHDPTNVTVQNLSVYGMYYSVPPTTNATQGRAAIAFDTTGITGCGNILCSNVVVHDAAEGFLVHYGPHWTNVTFKNCTGTNCNHDFDVGDGNNVANSLLNCVMSNCTFGLTFNWDENGANPGYPNNHHDGVQVHADAGPLTNCVFINCQSLPGFGNESTAAVYVSGFVYTNILYSGLWDCGSDGTACADGIFYSYLNVTAYSPTFLLNNTFFALPTNELCIDMAPPVNNPSGLRYWLTNNLFTNCLGTCIAQYNHPSSTTASDYNLYSKCSLVGVDGPLGSSTETAFVSSGTTSPAYLSLTNMTGVGSSVGGWQNFGFDLHCVTGNPLLVNWIPQPTSAAIGNGNDLTVLFAALNLPDTDANGVQRSTTIGAFEPVPVPPPPSTGTTMTYSPTGAVLTYSPTGTLLHNP